MIIPFNFDKNFYKLYKPRKNDYCYVVPFYYDYNTGVSKNIFTRSLYNECIKNLKLIFNKNIIIYLEHDGILSTDQLNYYKNELNIDYIIYGDDIVKYNNIFNIININNRNEIMLNYKFSSLSSKNLIDKINTLYYNFPKVDLHCHLDGSFNIEALIKYCNNNNIYFKYSCVDDYIKNILKNHDNLADYLSMFDEPVSIMQYKDILTELTSQLIDDANLDYLEIRFAPQLHTKKGLTQEDAVNAVLNGIKDKRKCKLILCMMRYNNASENWAENLETVMLANKYKDKGVCCVDLACNEPDDLLQYKPLFDLCNFLGVKTICHGGESKSYQNVNQCLDMNVLRIGHGIGAIDSDDTIKRLIDTNTPIEVCPTSNVQCHNVRSYEDHPAYKLYKDGVHVTINTDCLTMSQVSLEDEYDHCLNEMGFNYLDILKMDRDAIVYSFADEEYKNEMLEKLDKLIGALNEEK